MYWSWCGGRGGVVGERTLIDTVVLVLIMCIIGIATAPEGCVGTSLMVGYTLYPPTRQLRCYNSPNNFFGGQPNTIHDLECLDAYLYVAFKENSYGTAVYQFQNYAKYFIRMNQHQIDLDRRGNSYRILQEMGDNICSSNRDRYAGMDQPLNWPTRSLMVDTSNNNTFTFQYCTDSSLKLVPNDHMDVYLTSPYNTTYLNKVNIQRLQLIQSLNNFKVKKNGKCNGGNIIDIKIQLPNYYTIRNQPLLLMVRMQRNTTSWYSCSDITLINGTPDESKSSGDNNYDSSDDSYNSNSHNGDHSSNYDSSDESYNSNGHDSSHSTPSPSYSPSPSHSPTPSPSDSPSPSPSSHGSYDSYNSNNHGKYDSSSTNYPYPSPTPSPTPKVSKKPIKIQSIKLTTLDKITYVLAGVIALLLFYILLTRICGFCGYQKRKNSDIPLQTFIEKRLDV